MEMAGAMGFQHRQAQEVGLATSELASNILKHAREGSILLNKVFQGNDVGFQVTARDQGPGMVNAEDALGDGFSTAGTLGYGLGTVNRLMDDLHIGPATDDGTGTHVVCTRWLRYDEAHSGRCPLDVGAASRPHPSGQVNGDAFVIHGWPGALLVAVIDGLGHGQFAHRAAQKARVFVEKHARQPLEEIFRGVHRECRTTRGVVMAVAKFDFGSESQAPTRPVAPGQVTFSYGNIGNIEARLVGNRNPFNIVLRRGILGKNAPSVYPTTHQWEHGSTMVIHSDGLGSHWSWKDFPELPAQSATIAAQRLLRNLARDTDDATVVVIKGK